MTTRSDVLVKVLENEKDPVKTHLGSYGRYCGNSSCVGLGQPFLCLLW